MGARIEVAGLTKVYGDLTAVDDLSFTIEPGEFFGLLGPNGAGKTTALEMIEGLRKPDAGTVTIDGLDPWNRDPVLQSRLGVQLQSSAFFERLSAREQLVTFAALYDAPTHRVDELLAEVGLEDKASSRVEKLSGGQAQRLSIACALVHDPEIVFLDEPTAALDPQARRNLWDFLRGMNHSGRTVVLTTHYMEEAEALCDRVAIIDQGRLVELDSPATLVRDLDAPTRISLAPEAISESAARELSGVDEVTVHPDRIILSTKRPAEVLAELARRDALQGLSASGASLEDVFLDRTGRKYRS